MAVKILEVCDVAPPNGSVQPCALPLTILDHIWYGADISVERLFLYHVPHCSAAAFLSTHLPNLKRSLSLALQLFHPMAGRLVPDAATGNTCLRYSDGDSVVLTVAESDDDLKELASDGPRHAARLRCLVPTLLRTQQLVGLQVTLFPDQGIAVGMPARHAVMDGSSSCHFLRTWASICKSEGGEEPPFYGRSQIWESVGLESPLFTRIKATKSDSSPKPRSLPDVVFSTFCLPTEQIEELRKWVANRASDRGSARFSSFTLAVAAVWTSLLKARGCAPKETEALMFTVDCRARLDRPLPAAYFGNALLGCFPDVEGNSLLGEDGLVTAALAVRDALREASVGVISLGRRLEEEFDRFPRVVALQPLTLAGSPRLRVYDLDFGWGRPRKVEVVSIDVTGAMSLSEMKRDGVEGGGLEIGLALPAGVMEDFTRFFSTALKKACS